MEEKPLMYFGHPINFYNTPKEIELLEVIERNFPQYSIENPNQPHHQNGYQRFKAERGNGMKYYFEEVLPKMNAGIFLTFEDGMFGIGVFGEAEFISSRGNPIWEVNLEGQIRTMFLEQQRKLTIEQTRERIYPKK